MQHYTVNGLDFNIWKRNGNFYISTFSPCICGMGETGEDAIKDMIENTKAIQAKAPAVISSLNSLLFFLNNPVGDVFEEAFNEAMVTEKDKELDEGKEE